jgi:hypothetical protein
MRLLPCVSFKGRFRRYPTTHCRVRCNSLTLNISLFLVRRAKLGFASQGEVLTPEALARRRVLSVASSAVTLAAKRTQGVHGPQCASVKGLSPVMRRTVGADVLSNTEGHIRGTNGHGPREPTGVEDRSTCTRQSRELGRSSGLLQGRGAGWYNQHTGRPANGPEEVGCPHTSDEAE